VSVLLGGGDWVAGEDLGADLVCRRRGGAGAGEGERGHGGQMRQLGTDRCEALGHGGGDDDEVWW
jgi:hypothetical protein